MTDMKGLKRVFFLGIGGIGMSALARYFHKRGVIISGYDRVETPLTRKLVEEGMVISYQDEVGKIERPDLVIYTPAVPSSSTLRKYFAESKVPMLKRSQVLGNISDSERTIAIAGTHGKTTTTSMITEILLAGNCDPTISVGGILHSIGGNVRVGKSDIFVTEACEYTNSFLSFYPTIDVILNVKADHLDFFKDIDDIRHSFKLFTEKLP